MAEELLWKPMTELRGLTSRGSFTNFMRVWGAAWPSSISWARKNQWRLQHDTPYHQGRGDGNELLADAEDSAVGPNMVPHYRCIAGKHRRATSYARQPKQQERDNILHGPSQHVRDSQVNTSVKLQAPLACLRRLNRRACQIQKAGCTCARCCSAPCQTIQRLSGLCPGSP